jgi:hypothetical protein
MIRSFLGVGDRAGEAVITEGLPNFTCSNPLPRVHLSTLYMRTWCNACKKEGFIAPSGPRWPGTAPNGKRWALSGDVNICGCSPPPIFYAKRNMAMNFTSDEVKALMSGCGSATVSNAGSRLYDQYFCLTDLRTGVPIRDAPYRIITDSGEEYSGRTDSQGHTRRITSDSALGATLHVLGEESPINPDWDS